MAFPKASAVRSLIAVTNEEVPAVATGFSIGMAYGRAVHVTTEWDSPLSIEPEASLPIAPFALTTTATREQLGVDPVSGTPVAGGSLPPSAGKGLAAGSEVDFTSLGSIGSVCVDWFAIPATAKSLGSRGISDLSHAFCSGLSATIARRNAWHTRPIW